MKFVRFVFFIHFFIYFCAPQCYWNYLYYYLLLMKNRLIKCFTCILVSIIGVISPVFAQSPYQETADQLEAINRTFEVISTHNAYVDDLSQVDMNHLPIGLKRTINNMEVTVAISRVVFTQEFSEFGVYAKAVLPQNADGEQKILFFGSEGVRGNHKGGIQGDLKLSLLKDISIPFNNGNMTIVLKGGFDNNRGTVESSTHMAIDCKGFKFMSLDADVLFPKTLLRAVDDNGNLSDEHVKGHFQTVVENWSDLMVQLDLPEFEITKLNGFRFALRNVVLDFSDLRNSDRIHFPENYSDKYMIPGAANLWRGVYAEELSITFPKQFNTIDGKATSISARNMIIDDNGISGVFEADTILALKQGTAGGWDFSVDRFHLELEANQLIEAGFAGELGLPFKKGKNTTLGYKGIIRPNNEYLMQINSVESIDFSIFNAKASILPNSYALLYVIDDRFIPEVVLHGSMSVIPCDTVQNGKAVPVSIPTIEFRSLKLTSVSPYISVEQLGYSGKSLLGKFPISLNSIGIRANNGTVRLTTDISLNLGDNLFAARTKLTLLAQLEEWEGRKKWVFDGVELDKIALDATIAEVLRLQGSLDFMRDDPVYGDGFAGDIGVTLKSFNGLQIQSRGAFGQKDDFKYWFAEGSSTFPTPIPISPPMTLSGAGMGVTYRMRGEGRSVSGKSNFSHSHYIPDSGRGLGLKASVLFGVGKIATGEGAFEIAFTQRGGLAYAGIFGYAQFPATGENSVKIPGAEALADKYAQLLKKEQEAAEAVGRESLERWKQYDPIKAANSLGGIPSSLKYGIRGTLGMQMDFINKSFHATTDVYINTPGNFLEGSSSGGRAGWGVLHLDPAEWYLHLGNPDNRIGIRLNLGNILGIETNSYFMSGSRIPEMPAPPIEVSAIIQEDMSSLTLGRNMEVLSTGRGLAFGSQLKAHTGDLTFLIMYANFAAGLGYDIMLKDYGDAQCKDRSGTVGLGGWYALGQTYAYLQGELGVKIKLWFLKTKIPVIKGGAATLLQAGLPDPTYFRGYLGVHLNVLGLIKGKMRFKLALGDECEIVMPGSSPVDMPMINDLSPANKETDVSVFTTPQATFNIPMGKSFEASGDAGVTYYRINLKDFDVQDEEGHKIEGKLIWNKTKDAVTFQAKEILPPASKLTASVRVGFEEFKNGAWTLVSTSGKEAYEEKVRTFTTGNAPSDIPMQNIVYTYPVVEQRHFLTGESKKGFVQLQFGQKYLFEKGFDYKLCFTREGQTPVATPFKYNEAHNRIEFEIPRLDSKSSYTLDISYSAQSQTSDSMGGDGNSEQSTSLINDEDGTVDLIQKKAVAGISEESKKSILSYPFASSVYATFKDKIGGMNVKNKAYVQDAGISVLLAYNATAKEAFDEAEIIGVEKTAQQPLIRVKAVLAEEFFTRTVIPQVYAGYPYGGVKLTHREDDPIGVPPYYSVFPNQRYLSALSDGVPSENFVFPYTYEASVIAGLDYQNLQSLVLNNRDKVEADVYRRFATGSGLPFLKKGLYKVILTYVLPDGTEIAKDEFLFNNFLNLNK